MASIMDDVVMTDMADFDGSKFDLRSLVEHSEVVQALDTLEMVQASFEQHPQSFMAVFEDGQIIGLCSRRRIGMALGSRQGLDTLSQRPVYEFIVPEMTVVRVGQSLLEILSVVFSRPQETLLNDVVLMDDNAQFLGLIYARSLVKLQYFVLQLNIEQIERSRKELDRQNDELNHRNVEMKNDLCLASEIQQALLPAAMSDPAGSPFRIAYCYQPMELVSGDFFHQLEPAPGKVGLFVCDVMGHGVRSAFITAMLRALIQQLHHLGSQPGELLAHLNEELKVILQRTDSPLYATAIYVVVDAATRTVCFANAGHPDPLLLQPAANLVKNASSAPKSKGPALGMRAGATYGQTTFVLPPGEILLLFTDGLCEIFNEQEQEFGREQLAESAQRHGAKPLQAALDGVVADALAFASGKFQDDICLVGLEVLK